MELRKNHGDEESRARDLFYALWIPDLFMERVNDDDYWYLMCPNECQGLSDCYGEDFELLYNSYVEEGKYRKKMKARELWFQILDSQMETGTPYMLYKDASNKKSNQKNLGTIKSSNLCTEIIEYSDDKETAVCNLASISLSAMVDEKTRTFNLNKLQNVTEIVTENLNKIIDKNFYPTIKTYRSNMNHRPIGIGVQGLADAFAKMDIPFDSDVAQSLNKDIFETIYYGSMKKSNELSEKRQLEIYNLQQELVDNLFDNNHNFLEWFLPLFNNNYYDKLFDYKLSNLVANDTSIYEDVYKNIYNNINNIYHRLKPTMKEIFGYDFYDNVKQFFDHQFSLHKYKYKQYEKMNEDLKLSLRNKNHCGSYSSFEGSPLSKGQFQFDLWNINASYKYDWNTLRENIIKYGSRNSLMCCTNANCIN